MYTQYKSLSSWFDEMTKDGYSIPLALCTDLSKYIKKYNCDFSTAYKIFFDNHKIIENNKIIIYDLSGNKLLDLSPNLADLSNLPKVE
jgi:hypothetical protein